MDFTAVIRLARQLHDEGRPLDGIGYADRDEVQLTEEVYGRICTSESAQPPEMLATRRGRKVVFVFGPDALVSVILRRCSYDAVTSLGFTSEYIHHEVVQRT